MDCINIWDHSGVRRNIDFLVIDSEFCCSVAAAFGNAD